MQAGVGRIFPLDSSWRMLGICSMNGMVLHSRIPLSTQLFCPFCSEPLAAFDFQVADLRSSDVQFERLRAA